MILSHLSNYTIVSVSLLLLIIIFDQLSRWNRNRAFAAANGCQSIPRFPRLKNCWMTIKSWKTHSTLDLFHWKYMTMGLTYASATVGFSDIIFTIEPENLKTILATDFQKWDLGPRRRKLLGPLVGKGIFTSDGPAWEHSRGLIRPSFTKLRMADVSLFEPHFQNLLSVLPAKNPVSGLVDVDLQPLIFRMALDSATDVLMGHSFESQLEPPESRSMRFMAAFDYAQLKTHVRYLMDRGFMKPLGLLLKIMYPNMWEQFDSSRRTVHDVIDEIVADFLVSFDREEMLGEKEDEDENEDDFKPKNGKNYVFLQELAKETRDPIELRDEILNVLVAGRDTTASLLSNALFALARHPDVWDRVRGEVMEAFGDRMPDYETLRNMKQLKNLLNECLRLWPPVPINSREANVNTILPKGGGPDGESPVFVRAGQSVNYYLYSLHRLPSVFGEDADIFRPDRWDDPELRPGWGYIPFNGGPRICPGQQFALTEASYILARLMQHITFIERRDVEEEWTEKVALVTKARNGVKVALKMTETENE